MFKCFWYVIVSSDCIQIISIFAVYFTSEILMEKSIIGFLLTFFRHGNVGREVS